MLEERASGIREAEVRARGRCSDPRPFEIVHERGHVMFWDWGNKLLVHRVYCVSEHCFRVIYGHISNRPLLRWRCRLAGTKVREVAITEDIWIWVARSPHLYTLTWVTQITQTHVLNISVTRSQVLNCPDNLPQHSGLQSNHTCYTLIIPRTITNMPGYRFEDCYILLNSRGLKSREPLLPSVSISFPSVADVICKQSLTLTI